MSVWDRWCYALRSLEASAIVMQSTSYSNPKHAEAVDEALKVCGRMAGALLPVLHAIQDRLGFVPPECIGPVAHALNLSRAEVHGVITFYHDFRSAPPGRHVLKLCRAEACQSMGSENLAAHVKKRHGLGFGDTTPDGALTLEAVYCLGNCALSPALMIDGQLRGRMTPERVDRVVASCKETP